MGTKICVGCESEQGKPHEKWCPVVTGTLGSMPENKLYSMVGSCGHAFDRHQLSVKPEEYCPRCGHGVAVLYASDKISNSDFKHHKALPHRWSEEVHEGWDREHCDRCRARARELAVHPTWNGKPLFIGDVLTLEEGLARNLAGSADVTLDTIRLNTYTGDVWMHCFEQHNLVIEMRHIVAVNGEERDDA